MSILARFHPANLTVERYDASHPKVEAAGFPADGLEYHVCFGPPDNLSVSEVWDSREQMEAWAPTLMPILEEFGIEQGAEPDIIEIHNIVRR